MSVVLVSPDDEMQSTKMFRQSVGWTNRENNTQEIRKQERRIDRKEQKSKRNRAQAIDKTGKGERNEAYLR